MSFVPGRNEDSPETTSSFQEHSEDVSPFLVARRQQRSWIYFYFYYMTMTSLRIHRLLIRPLVVLILGYCVLHISEDRNTNPSLKNLEFRFTNATREEDSSSPGIFSSLSRRSFQPPYFTRHLPLHSSSAPAVDPQTYGWEPNMYPDPKLEPHKCGIAYLLEDEQYAVSNASLPLCDPDWVLGGMYLEEIAVAMTNFMNNYSSPPGVTISPPGRRIEEQDTQISIESTSSGDMLEQGEQPHEGYVQQKSPFVELAVATARKVRYIHWMASLQSYGRVFNIFLSCIIVLFVLYR
jgi:hypothetical protein